MWRSLSILYYAALSPHFRRLPAQRMCHLPSAGILAGCAIPRRSLLSQHHPYILWSFLLTAQVRRATMRANRFISWPARELALRLQGRREQAGRLGESECSICPALPCSASILGAKPAVTGCAPTPPLPSAMTVGARAA